MWLIKLQTELKNPRNIKTAKMGNLEISLGWFQMGLFQFHFGTDRSQIRLAKRSQLTAHP